MTIEKVLGSLERRFGSFRKFTEDNPLDQLILLILLRGTTVAKAQQALEGLKNSFVDWNEVRVSGVHEIREAAGLDGVERARLVQQILSSIYARYNTVKIDFILERGDRQAKRQRERLIALLEDKVPGLAAVMGLFGSTRLVAFRVNANVTRPLSRLGLLKKGDAIPMVRKRLEKEVPDSHRLLFLWAFEHLAAENCTRAMPLCRSCVMKKNCVMAPAEIERARKADALAAEKQAREDARIALREAAEEKKRQREEERELKVRERAAAKIAAIAKRKAEAKAKVLAKKKAAVKKKAAAKKKAEAKKAAVIKKKAEAKKKAEDRKKEIVKKKAAAKKKAAVKKKAATKKKSAVKKKAAVKKKPATRKKAVKKKTPARKKVAPKKKTSSRKKPSKKKK